METEKADFVTIADQVNPTTEGRDTSASFVQLQETSDSDDGKTSPIRLDTPERVHTDDQTRYTVPTTPPANCDISQELKELIEKNQQEEKAYREMLERKRQSDLDYERIIKEAHVTHEKARECIASHDTFLASLPKQTVTDQVHMHSPSNQNAKLDKLRNAALLIALSAMFFFTTVMVVHNEIHFLMATFTYVVFLKFGKLLFQKEHTDQIEIFGKLKVHCYIVYALFGCISVLCTLAGLVKGFDIFFICAATMNALFIAFMIISGFVCMLLVLPIVIIQGVLLSLVYASPAIIQCIVICIVCDQIYKHFFEDVADAKSE